jgi:hypothetical protein
MAKPLPNDDFRAIRVVLEPSDFAVGSEFPDPPPIDLISKETWNHLVGLPDDVAVRTSNNFGGILKEVSEFQSELVNVSLALQDLITQAGLKVEGSPICHVLLAATDELAASIYNGLIGYYRVAFSALRNVVENLAIGLHLELSSDLVRFQSWLAGDIELKFGWAADNAPQNKAVSDFETYLTAAITDNLFRQRAGTNPGGFARRLFGKLSKFTHGGPGFTDGDLRESNGPVFVPPAFIDWAIAFIQVCAFCLIACRLAQPRLRGLGSWSKMSVEQLFNQASCRLRAKDDGAKLFQNLPVNFW